MCANYELISRDRILHLDLLESTFQYKTDIHLSGNCPLIFSNQGQVEWREVKFGLVPKWTKDLKICRNTYKARTETANQRPCFKHI
jgi:putative SOS response-associated peptidase YedK